MRLRLALLLALFLAPLAPHSIAASPPAPLSPGTVGLTPCPTTVLPLAFMFPTAPALPLPGLPAQGWSTYHSVGKATCNCPKEEDDGPEEHTVCISSSVKVQVGSEIISVSTGVSTGTCAKKTLRPGRCLFYVYNFYCEPGSWLSSAKCVYLSAGTQTRKSTSRDCPDIPQDS